MRLWQEKYAPKKVQAWILMQYKSTLEVLKLLLIESSESEIMFVYPDRAHCFEKMVIYPTEYFRN